MKKTGGVDEAGRGPWAGPVVAACVILDSDIPRLDEINDSKSISEKKRKELYEIIKEHSIYGIGVASNIEIDKLGIVKATELAVKRAIEHMPQKPSFLLVDGRDKFDLPIKFKSIINGDKKVKSIAAASILAKVWRDEYMKLANDIYPQYGFEKHKGYGTKLHTEMLKKHGICEIHRLSYKPIQKIIEEKAKKPKLLLHACCAPCATSVIERLKPNYEIEVFFYNPNIHPKREYNIRLDEIKRLCRHHKIKLYIGEYDTKRWFKITKNYKFEKEGEKRCYLCYGLRILETAKLANKLGFDYFTTTLSVSPLKKYNKIKRIGEILADKFNLQFKNTDFKKQDGFKRSVELSKQFNFYRQNYCGCVYSMRDRKDKT
jgi:ribonuclease HII